MYRDVSGNPIDYQKHLNLQIMDYSIRMLLDQVDRATKCCCACGFACLNIDEETGLSKVAFVFGGKEKLWHGMCRFRAELAELLSPQYSYIECFEYMFGEVS